ncbi:MAG: peptidoglycan DD-metalloendopeptidase family protein [Pseudomonadota bacterium]
MKLVPVVLILLVLGGCEGPGFAPIKDKTQAAARSVAKTKPAPRPESGQYVVQKGDTLYAIAFANGLDYRELAAWNNLESPDVIKVGQVLRLTSPDAAVNRAKGVETLPMRETAPLKLKPLGETAPLLTEPKAQRLPYSEANWAEVSAPKPLSLAGPKKPAEPSPSVAAESADGGGDAWRWPANGKLVGTFGQGGGKGIDIAGERNSPVLATAPGKVVYSGEGLRGYGKMLIVKHSDEFLTAYAHNQTLLAKEGDWVKGGQKIAEMGDTDSDQVKLHFEVRQYGKPLDPLKYLPERK